MTVFFDTRAYEFAHGHAPRGCGAWAFQMGETYTNATVHWVYGMSYSKAKKRAAVEANKRGVRNVKVLKY